MTNFPTTPEETRRWLKVCERNLERDAWNWWSRRTSLEELDPKHMTQFATPATAENRVYAREVVGTLERLEGHEQALWFLENCDRNKDWREAGLTSTERVKLFRMRRRLKEKLS